MKKSILPAAILFLGIFFYPTFAESVSAACDFHTLMTTTVKNVSNWTTPCTVAAVEGIDNAGDGETSTVNTAALSLGTGGSITINNGGKLVVGSLQLGSGSIAIQTGGEIRTNAPIYVTDTDTDGWPSAFTFYDATASGRRRLSLMRSFSTADCNDTNDFRLDNQCCAVATRYQDLDGDTYGNPSVSISACTTAGYVDNNTDCYDADPATTNAELAYPTSTTCSTANRGDGSYDYNCLSGGTACGSTYYNAVGHYLVNCAPGCTQKTSPYYTCAEGTVACGAAGYLNIGGANYWYQCGNCEGPNIYCPSIGASGNQACQ